MSMLLDPEKQFDAWRDFIENQIVQPGMDPQVASSWQRCWARLNPDRLTPLSHLNPTYLLSTQVIGFELISLARPIMEDIYQYLEGSSSALVLTNNAMYILDMVGDPDVLEKLAECGITPGSLLAEMEMGTNAFALAIRERSPLCVVGAQHYLRLFHNLAEAAAPVFDPTGRPLGVIGVIDIDCNYYPHTLGLVVAGSRAIEGMRQADILLAEQNSHMARLTAIIEANSNGLMVVDHDGILMQINDAATQILGLSRQAILGKKVEDIVTCPRFVSEAIVLQEPLHEVEVAVKIGERTIHCILSLHFIQENHALRWMIVTMRQEQEVHRLVHQQVGAQAPLTLDDIPGESAEIKRIHRFVKTAAPAQEGILIRGESGTGKNVLASAIHNASPRKDGPFLIVGCTSIPHEWMVSQLVGYAEGADSTRPGGRPSKFELASGGTIFFQDIDDMSLEAQSILLNVLDLGIVQRLGSSRPIDVDVRIIASTIANIERLITQGNFRADLYYRLSGFEITTPPLREHMSDLPLIVDRILTRLKKQLNLSVAIEADALRLLKGYHYPGNVRELESILGRAAVQAGATGLITPAQLPDRILKPYNHLEPKQAILTMHELEKEAVIQAAQACQGNLSEMAKLLGIGRTTVWRRLKQYRIMLDDYRPL